MKRILFLTTGGTIASTQSEEGLVPTVNGNQMFASLGEWTNNYAITVKDILNLDSSNLQPEEWQLMAKEIVKGYEEGFDGIVISHGTDTMAYSASALSYMLQGLPLPVVLTGSQLPLQDPLTDGVENLRTAFGMASSGIGGVFIAFNRKVILGCRATKTRTSGFDAFESINCPNLAQTSTLGLTFNQEVISQLPSHPFSLRDSLCTDVFLLKLIPGTKPELFETLRQMGYKGVVIEAFGCGGIHFHRRDLPTAIHKVIEKGMQVVVRSQCFYEPSDLTAYQVGVKLLEAGAIPAGDMTCEAAVTKLMWALANCKDTGEIRQCFQTNLVGEIHL